MTRPDNMGADGSGRALDHTITVLSLAIIALCVVMTVTSEGFYA